METPRLEGGVNMKSNHMQSNLFIRPLEITDPPMISAPFTAMGWRKPESQYHLYYQEQEEGKRVTLVAFADGEFAGYGNIIWDSNYPPFQEKSIPEISDLNVLPKFRRQGVATAIMDRAEAMMFERSDTIGIGVGLYDSYGPAQRMYVLRGYVPDGRGITCNHHERVCGGDSVVANDDLVLWFTKSCR